MEERSGVLQIMVALSTETRWGIMEVLTEHARAMSVSEIITELDGKLPQVLGRNSIQPHLNKLVDAGLVICRKDALQNTYLCSNPHFLLYLVALCNPIAKEKQ